MKFFIILFILFFQTTQIYSKSVEIIQNKEEVFNPFKCDELQTDFLRTNGNNSCVIIQKLSNAFEIKWNNFDKNTWQSPQIISFEKHQIIPTTINVSFRIEKADVNKDGTIDLYGFVQGYPNPWINCKREQLKSIYLNQNGEYFEKTSKKFIKDSFGMYGCERASNFFEKDGKYYRLFITMPSAESEEAYLGIERY